MTKKKFDPVKIQRDIGKLLAEKIGVPVLIVDEEKVKKIYEALKQDPKLSNHYTDEELYREVSRFYTNMMVVPPKSDKELNKRIKEFEKNITTEKKYTAIILLEGVYDLPIGTRIGNLRIIKQDMRKKSLKEHLEYLEKKNKIKIDRCSWCKIEFKSYRSEKIHEVLHSELEIPFSILSLLLHRHIDPKQIAGVVYADSKRTHLLEPSIEFRGWTKFDKKHFGKYLSMLSKITQKQNPTKLEQKILRSLPIYWLSQSSHKAEIQFLLLVSSTESLLLTENDKDYLGMKIAEKTAFLLSDEGNQRLKIYKIMKKFYSKRSKIVHAGKKDVSQADVQTMQNGYFNLVLKLLDLSKKYKRMEQKSNENQVDGIEDLMLKRKFNVNV